MTREQGNRLHQFQGEHGMLPARFGQQTEFYTLEPGVPASKAGVIIRTRVPTRLIEGRAIDTGMATAFTFLFPELPDQDHRIEIVNNPEAVTSVQFKVSDRVKWLAAGFDKQGELALLEAANLVPGDIQRDASAEMKRWINLKLAGIDVQKMPLLREVLRVNIANNAYSHALYAIDINDPFQRIFATIFDRPSEVSKLEQTINPDGRSPLTIGVEISNPINVDLGGLLRVGHWSVRSYDERSELAWHLASPKNIDVAALQACETMQLPAARERLRQFASEVFDSR